MLIDGDNAQPSLIEHVLAETAKYGIVTTRRIYETLRTEGVALYVSCPEESRF